MKRIDRLLEHELFKEYMEKIYECEYNRVFCRHNMEHFLSVARIAHILNLKYKLKIDKACVYGAALLHDIGRFKQYEDGTPHDKASAALALKIVRDCRYDEEESDMIIEAIRNHRNGEVREEKSLRGIIFRADKLSRSCFACPVERECNRKEEKKNRALRY